jgi:hypothetical protein
MKRVFFAFLVALLFWGSSSCVFADGGNTPLDKIDAIADDVECIVDIDFDNIIDLGDGSEPIFNGPGIKKGAKIVKCNLDNGVSKEKNLNVLLIGWMKFFLSVTAVVAVLAIVFAGFLYITAGGDDAQTTKAKKVVMWVAIGIILIFGSYAIVNTIMKARFGPNVSANLNESTISSHSLL